MLRRQLRIGGNMLPSGGIERRTMANDNNTTRPALAAVKSIPAAPQPVAAPITSYRVQAILTLFR